MRLRYSAAYRRGNGISPTRACSTAGLGLEQGEQRALERVAIWGASGHALVVADAVRRLSIIGFLDDRTTRKGEDFSGKTILGGRDVLDDLSAQGVRLIHIAIGHCPTRMKLADLAVSKGFELAQIVHPSAVVSEQASIGPGTFVAAGVVVGPAVHVGQCVILNTSSSVDHECVVEEGAHVGPGANLGGQVQIGRGVWVGIGATILHRVKIGAASIVGGGAVVVRDIPPGVVAYGAPARVARLVRPDE